MAKPVSYPGPGCVVEYMQGNRPQLAFIVETKGAQFRLLTQSQREMRLPSARVLPWAGPQCEPGLSRQAMLDALDQLDKEREALCAQVDALEIWELAQGEVDQAQTSWFAELIWDADQVDADRLAAMGRSLLDCKTHFKFHPPYFEIYPREKVEDRLAQQAATRERELLSASGSQIFAELWDVHLNKQPALKTQLEPETAAKLRALLLTRLTDPEDRDSEAVWKTAKRGLPDDPHLALHLARAWDVVPRHFNFLLGQAGYQAGDVWSQAHSGEIQAQRDALARDAAGPEPVPFVSVDSETTRDVDDAFFCAKTGQGFRLLLAIANPTLYWDTDTPLGKAVARRATSLYLPEGDSHMLPEALGTDLFSLLQDQVRPSLAMEMELDESGAILSFEPRQAWVRIRSNLSYPYVEQCLDSPENGPEKLPAEDVCESMRQGYSLSLALREHRLKGGAIVIEREDPEIQLQDRDGDVRVSVAPKPEAARAQLLVSEFMILANRAVAQWARERGIPLLHRTQDIGVPKESMGVWNEPQDIQRVVKILGASILEIKPRPHASLGVPAYSPISSPLRRYPDFLNLMQVTAYLRSASPCFSGEQLESMLPSLNARLEAVGRIQRYRPRYWKLLYIKQQGSKHGHQAVVVEENQAFVSVSLPDLQIFVRGPRKLFGDKINPGQRFIVHLGKVDPLNNTIHILEALEE